MHEKEAHDKKLSFSNIIYGFGIDETFFKMLIETMYEGEDHNIPSLKCEMCNFNANGKGVRKIHELKIHEKKTLFHQRNNSEPYHCYITVL